MTVRWKLVLMCACVAGVELAAALAETSFSNQAAKHQLGSRRVHQELDQLSQVETGLAWQLKELDDIVREGAGTGERSNLDQLLDAQKHVDRLLLELGGDRGVDRTTAHKPAEASDRHDRARLASLVRALQHSVREMARRKQGRPDNEELEALEIDSRKALDWLARVMARARAAVAASDAQADRWTARVGITAWMTPLLCGVILIVAIFMVLRSIADPLSDLVKGATRVASGNLEIAVPVRSKDDLGQLAAAFNEMMVTLRTRVAERDAALLDARFRDVSEAAPIAIAEVDEAGRPLYANRRWIELTGGAPAPDRPWSVLVLEADRERADKLRPGGAITGVELRLQTAGGTVWVAAKMAPLGGNHGDRSILALADITTQKNAIARAEELGRELMVVSRQAGMAEISAGVLHNVGNVLNSVLVAAGTLKEQLTRSRIANLVKATQLLEEHGADLADFLASERGRLLPTYLVQAASSLAEELESSQEDLARIAKGTEHIRAIITTQLSYAKPGAHNEELQLSEVIEDVLTMNEALFDRHHVRIARRYDADPVLLTDRHRIMQILINLIGNARHALQVDGQGREQPTVEISTRLITDDRIALAVADNGIGISPENVNRIFQHGFTTRRNGHGFGLHSSAQAARDLGGQLRVDSPGPGLGATFTLELPLASAPSVHPL